MAHILANKSELAAQVPEILAPAGGRAQFFAALHAGADAVYLGLKQFNARGRAENFDFDDLRELLPLAREQAMKVLVTLNIILKETELPRLIDDLAQLQCLGVDAVILQDLGVARIVREKFPGLRMHASTQLAIHNLEGVKKAHQLGFRRVVLARELTAQDLRLIRRGSVDTAVELEAFCHGSLCYSYSGLCFFSGAEDARSGNRGECAYTCRKPYKILSEPGHGFLFSMKDLDSSQDLDSLVRSGVHTLKIEGRKKDAQYVATAVGLYRQNLNRIFGRDTAPAGRSIERDFRTDMDFSFHRDTTSFYLKGRYHENVIDLDNPTHKGRLIGKVSQLKAQSIVLKTEYALERFDGLRIDRPVHHFHAKPQHGDKINAQLEDARKRYNNQVCQFSLRELSNRGRRLQSCPAGTLVEIGFPNDVPKPQLGDLVYKVRSNELKRTIESISQAKYRLRAAYPIAIKVSLFTMEDQLTIEACALVNDHPLATATITLPAVRPDKPTCLKDDLIQSLKIFGDIGFEAKVQVSGDDQFFVPRQQLKRLKQDLAGQLPNALQQFIEGSKAWAKESLSQRQSPLKPATQAIYSVKTDRLAVIEAVLKYKQDHPTFGLNEIIFEPKRAFLGNAKATEFLADLFPLLAKHDVKLRLALPTVLRAWDMPSIKPWIKSYVEQGGRSFELGNLGAFQILQDLGLDLNELDLATDFTVYSLNTQAISQISELGIKTLSLSIEDDSQNLGAILGNWPNAKSKPRVIVFKDTPLFIAEACSLTALHNGCPGPKVCGYRSLEIANEANERFHVAHEGCKSVVYGDDAFAISQHQNQLLQQGVEEFRIDFLSRPYTEDRIHEVLMAISVGGRIKGTYPGNFERKLL